MPLDLEQFREQAETDYKDNQKFLRQLKQRKPKKLDQQFLAEHDKEFEKTDCLTCANCCKTTSPIFTQTDIERVAKHVGMSVQPFIRQYLKVDEDDDHVLKSSPCPFLYDDNYCSVYESRPKACREYPHTNRKRMSQIMDLTLKNTTVCPAVLNIVNRLRIGE